MESVRWLLVVILVLGGAAARAQPGPQDRPWAAGVPEAEQARALELYTQGNAEFAQERFAQALALYREAIAHWDHPAIEFNMAVCLINLDQPLEARMAIEKSLAFGAAALGSQYAQALADRKLLDERLAFVTITCREPQAQVMVDGVELFVGPGSTEQVLLPGRHEITAVKAGYVTASESLFLSPGKQIAYDVRLVALTSTTHVVRRWPVWQPWAILGAGVVMIGVGEIFHANALEESRFDAMRDRAKRDDIYSLSAWSVAGVLATIGIAGVVLNEPRTVVDAAKPMPSVVPVAGGAVLSIGGGF
jgi:hypothetical protein